MSDEDAALVRQTFDAIHSGEHQEAVRRFHADAVWQNTAAFPGPRCCVGPQVDRSRLGLEVVQSRHASLQALTSLWRTFEDLELEEEEEITDFGDGVRLAVYAYRGRPGEGKA